MQELRLVLIIVGALAIAALLFHGLWSSRKEKPAKFGEKPLNKIDESNLEKKEIVEEEKVTASSTVNNEVQTNVEQPLAKPENNEKKPAPERKEPGFNFGDRPQYDDPLLSETTPQTAHAEVKTASHVRIEPQMHIAPEVVAQATATPEPIAQVQASVAQQTIAQAQATVTPEPVVQVQATVTPEPAVQAQATVTPQPTVQAQAPVMPEPVVQVQAVFASQPEVTVENVVESQPVVNSQSQPEISAVEPVITPVEDNKIEPVIEPEIIVEAEPIVEIEPEPKPEPLPSTFLSLCVQARNGKKLRGPSLFACLERHGLLFGENDVFHRYADIANKEQDLFFVANLLNPGTFPEKNYQHFETPGIKFFLMLPCEYGKASSNFNLMLQTAQQIADELNADVMDKDRVMITPNCIAEYRDIAVKYNAN